MNEDHIFCFPSKLVYFGSDSQDFAGFSFLKKFDSIPGSEDGSKDLFAKTDDGRRLLAKLSQNTVIVAVRMGVGDVRTSPVFAVLEKLSVNLADSIRQFLPNSESDSSAIFRKIPVPKRARWSHIRQVAPFVLYRTKSCCSSSRLTHCHISKMRPNVIYSEY